MNGIVFLNSTTIDDATPMIEGVCVTSDGPEVAEIGRICTKCTWPW